MLGALIGDTVGSVYEFANTKKVDFQPLFHEEANYTDDSIMTVAVADWLMNTNRSQAKLEEKMVHWATKYRCPLGGYGGGFYRWLFRPEMLGDYREDGTYNYNNELKRHPYNSWGNGSAMRCSACGWVATSLDDALDLAKRSAEITHNHLEGIKGAQATVAAIYMALHGEIKEAIRNYVEKQFGYNLHLTCNDIRPTYHWEASCQGTVPPAIVAFLDSKSLEDAVRLAVSLGGDSDTLACITGGIAEAYAIAHSDATSVDYYEGITTEMRQEMNKRLPDDMKAIVLQCVGWFDKSALH